MKQHQNNPAKIYVAVKDDMMIARGIMENNMDVLRQYEVGFWITENMYCVDDNNEDLIRSVAEGSDVENCIVHLQVGIRDFIKSIESFTANLQK